MNTKATIIDALLKSLLENPDPKTYHLVFEHLRETYKKTDDLEEALWELLSFFERKDLSGKVFWDMCLNEFPEAQMVVNKLLRDENRWYELYLLSFLNYYNTPGEKTYPKFRRSLEDSLSFLLSEKTLVGKNKDSRKETLHALGYALTQNPEEFKAMIPHSKTLEEIMPLLFKKLTMLGSGVFFFNKEKEEILDLTRKLLLHYPIITESEIPLLLTEERSYYENFLTAFLIAFLEQNPDKKRAEKVAQRMCAFFNWGGNRSEEEAERFYKDTSQNWETYFNEKLSEEVMPSKPQGILSYASKYRNW